MRSNLGSYLGYSAGLNWEISLTWYIETYQKVKTPGPDGLSVEFYLRSWSLLGEEMVQSLNYAYECKFRVLEINKLQLWKTRTLSSQTLRGLNKRRQKSHAYVIFAFFHSFVFFCFLLLSFVFFCFLLFSFVFFCFLLFSFVFFCFLLFSFVFFCFLLFSFVFFCFLLFSFVFFCFLLFPFVCLFVFNQFSRIWKPWYDTKHEFLKYYLIYRLVFTKKLCAPGKKINCSTTKTKKQVLNEIVWNNHHIKIEGNSIYYKKWYDAGSTKFEDFFQGKFLTFEEFCRKFKIKANLFKLLRSMPCSPSKMDQYSQRKPYWIFGKTFWEG